MGAVLFLVNAGAAWSQVGGLINKRLPREVPGAPNQGAPPQFDDVTLEITTDRIDKLLAAKQAARRLADAPTGPAALRQKADQLDERQGDLYSKHIKDIQKWDEKRMAVETCRDSALSAIRDSKQATGMQDMQKMQQIGLAVAMAQQKGDTAEVRRLTEQFRKGQEPSAADSAAVVRKCGDPSPIGVVKEWATLKDQIEQLRNQANQAEAQIDKTETSLSSMNARQRAVSCERIKRYIEQLRKKQKWAGFSDAEVKAMQAREQAIKDLEALCP
jgi:hypothetical protein